MGDENAQRVIMEQEQAASMRGNWDSTCIQIAKRILPGFADTFAGQNRTLNTPNYQDTAEMVDSTGALALNRFAAAMESMNTPHTSTWHVVLPQDKVLMKNRSVRLWFEDLTELLFTLRYAPTANFASQKYADYKMIGAFGNAILFTDALKWRGEKGFRYRSIHPGQCYFMENHQGMIDRNYRRFPLTAAQALTEFGAEMLPPQILAQAKEGRTAQTIHYFIHKVSPRADGSYDPYRVDVAGMAYESCYVSITGQQTVRENGYHTFPYAISRYSTLPGQIMGTSIAMMALPSLKTLNEMKKTVLKQGHRTVDPVLLAHDDGVMDSFSLRPGSLNMGGVSAEGKPLVHVLPTGNLAVGIDMMEAESKAAKDFFLVTLFDILLDAPQMTATQAIERAREKAQLLTPEIRQQAESLGPQIDREIDLAVQLRLLDPMPQMLLDAKGKYTVRYDSPMARMARGSERNAGFTRMVDRSLELVNATGNPEHLDHYNFDVAIPEMADDQSVPQSWMNDPAKKKEIRDGRAEQAQQQQTMDALPAAGGLMKTMMPKPQAAPAHA